MDRIKEIVSSFIKPLIPPKIIQQRLIERGEGNVLLTFDDGPHPDITPKVLDLLDKYQARALFFITGSRIDGAPKLLKETIRRGHQIGNHTYSHFNYPIPSFRQCRIEILKCQEKIYDITGMTPIYFRPPRGKISLPMLFGVKYLRMKIIRWTIDTGEYSYMQDATAEELADNLIRKIDNRAIVLSHDDNEKILKLLEIVLPKLVEMRFNLYNGLDYLV